MADPFFRANWREAVTRASQSNFCTGGGSQGWKADADWFLQPDNVVKLMENRYGNRSAPSAKDGTPAHPQRIFDKDAYKQDVSAF
jgi:hypothetical protein